MSRWLPFLVLLSACGGLSEKKYFEEIGRPLCEAHAACNDELSVEDCLAIPPEVDFETCDYDSKAADECAEALQSTTCSADEGFGVEFTYFEPPAICSDVYVNCKG